MSIDWKNMSTKPNSISFEHYPKAFQIVVGNVAYDARSLASFADAKRNSAGQRVYWSGLRQPLTPDEIAKVERIRAVAIRELGDRAGVKPFSPVQPRAAQPNHEIDPAHPYEILEMLRWTLDQPPETARFVTGDALGGYWDLAIPGMRASDYVKVFGRRGHIAQPTIRGFLQAVHDTASSIRNARGRITNSHGRPAHMLAWAGGVADHPTRNVDRGRHVREWTFQMSVDRGHEATWHAAHPYRSPGHRHGGRGHRYGHSARVWDR